MNKETTTSVATWGNHEELIRCAEVLVKNDDCFWVSNVDLPYSIKEMDDFMKMIKETVDHQYPTKTYFFDYVGI